MTIALQLVEFESSGVLGSAWTATGGTFTQDGQRAYPTTPATYSRAVLVAAPNLSASTPIKGRYEIDVTLPASFPATGVVRAGVVFAGGYADLVWTRASGGGSTLVDFFGRHGTTGVETSFFSITVSFAAGSTFRLRADVAYNAANLVVVASYSTDGGQTFTAAFLSSPLTAAWNLATGQTLTTITASARTGGIVANVAGPPAFVDNYRVSDIGSLADQPSISAPPSATAFPTLTPVAMSAEDDGGAEVLSVQPSYAMQVEDDWDVVEHPYDGGYTGTVARQTVNRRQWVFHWDAMNASETTALGTLRAAVVGGTSAFTWTDPTTSEAVRIHFREGPRVSLVAPGIYQAEALVREVLS